MSAMQLYSKESGLGLFYFLFCSLSSLKNFTNAKALLHSGDSLIFTLYIAIQDILS